jgi:hypothetical protein
MVFAKACKQTCRPSSNIALAMKVTRAYLRLLGPGDTYSDVAARRCTKIARVMPKVLGPTRASRPRRFPMSRSKAAGESMPRDGSLILTDVRGPTLAYRVRGLRAGTLPRDSIIPPAKRTPEHDWMNRSVRHPSSIAPLPTVLRSRRRG